MRLQILFLVIAAALIGQSSSLGTAPWVSGEIAYRVTVVPQGSVAARIGLRTGDVLAEPGPLPARLREAPAGGVEIPLFRLNDGKYQRTKIKVTFTAGEEKRLGTTGDLGFLVTAVEPGSLGARSELLPGDFIPQINDTFVHSVDDLKLVNEAYDEGTQVLIHVTRWLPEKNSFQNFISRRKFRK
jgi:S1-C subfamily serine protease